MKILGIDPGPESTAIVVLNGRTIEWAYQSSNQDILSCMSMLDYDEIACEHIQCMGMAVGKSVFDTAYWIGEYRHLSRMLQKPFHRVFRNEEKMALCGNVRAKDSNIRQALLDMFGPPGTKKAPGPTYLISKDLWSALAVAVTFAKQ